ncbi:MAG: hypothetical protein NT176_17100 [Proteobacteria bacterium]|nr:hypothetical protein [Pseudomonadota bacterium]
MSFEELRGLFSIESLLGEGQVEPALDLRLVGGGKVRAVLCGEAKRQLEEHDKGRESHRK